MNNSAYHRVSLLVVQDIPKVDKNGNTDANNSEDTVDFGAPGAGHEGTSEGQPDPPLCRKFSVFG